MTNTWWIYLIRCRRGELYTGICTDVPRRFDEHQKGGARAAKYLRGRGPLTLAGRAQVGERSLALRLEARVKRLPAAAKADLFRRPARLGAMIETLLG